MSVQKIIDISYYPGCSLKSSSKDNDTALYQVMRLLGFNLIELEDWNCCGASSGHGINPELALDLSYRNLSLSPAERPLMAPCPNCLIRLKAAHQHLKTNPEAQHKYKKIWQRDFDPNMRIMHLFDLLDMANIEQFCDKARHQYNGLAVVPYYGCLLSRPPVGLFEKSYYGKMENLLKLLGCKVLSWSYVTQCCGTFLSITRPEVVSPLVDRIMQGAIEVGADCIVTICELCQMNLEVRCRLEKRVPIIPFSQLIAITFNLGGLSEMNRILSHLIIDPRPMLRSKGLIS